MHLVDANNDGNVSIDEILRIVIDNEHKKEKKAKKHRFQNGKQEETYNKH